MTAEVAILRAYAFASQGKYTEAEQLLTSAPEALNTPSGADLFARIKFEQGDEAIARHIWEQLLADDTTNESAQKALAALDASPCESDADEVVPCFYRRWKFVCAGILAVLLGLAFSLGKAWKGTSSGTLHESVLLPCLQPRIIAEQMLEISKINGEVLAELRNGILTNMTEETMLVLSGGRGRYITDRQKCLSVIAEVVSAKTKVPFSNILFKASDKNSEAVKFSVMKGLVNDN